MQLIPVLDLCGGRAVRAIGGWARHEYPPLESVLRGGEGEFMALAEGLARLQPSAVYVADLDAIEGRPGNHDEIAALLDAGLKLWLDAGFADCDPAERSLGRHGRAAAIDLVAGLESLPDPAALEQLIDRFGPQRVIFSLDLRDGRPLGTGWGLASADAIARAAQDCGVRRMILLDLAAVGRGAGTPTLELCARLRAQSDLELITGGGVRDESDLAALAAAGCSAALLGAALHEGRIAREEFLRWNAPPLQPTANFLEPAR
jgi:phosphoribosylformimino-5-aminoimidazole carboxamide ribotide isomerase